MSETTRLRTVQVARGTYEVRRIVPAKVREAWTGPEREPLTWEEYFSLPAEQRGGGDRGAL